MVVQVGWRRGGYGPYLELGVWLAVAFGFWLYAELTDRTIPFYELQVMTWPRGAIYLIALAAILNFLFKLPAAEEEEKIAPEAYAAGAPVGWLHLGAMFGWPLLYFWFLPRVGFFVATPVFIPAYMFVFRQKRAIHLFGTALVFYLVVAVVFSRFLYIPLPTGNWPGFYEINVNFFEFLREG